MDIRIANPPKEMVEKYSKDAYEFYSKYANLVCEILKDKNVQKFIDKMITKECIEKKVSDVRVMLFPSLKGEMARGGTYNAKLGQISIFNRMEIPEDTPKHKMKWLIDMLEDKKIVEGIFIESVLNLIHEVLHVKYSNDYMEEHGLTRDEIENKVKNLSEKYLDEFFKGEENNQ